MVVSKDGGNVRIYLNGKLLKTCAYTGSDTNSEKWFIGRSNDGAPYWYYFHGKIDDARIYNRVLSAAEVQQLYKWAMFAAP